MPVPLFLPFHRKLPDAEDKRMPLVLHLMLGNGKGKVRKARQEVPEDNVEFHTRQCLSDTLMDAIAERHMVTRIPGDVEPVRVLERVLVPVGRTEQAENTLAGPDQLAADFDVADGDAIAVEVGNG